MYKINNLSHKIAKKNVLQNINLYIKTNSFLTILGTNGSGKSTLIKLINKNIHFYSGEIILDEKDISNLTDKELANKRAVLNQSIHFEYNFKAIEIIKMGFYSSDLSSDEKQKIQDYVIKKMDLTELLERNYSEFSGGEKQKIQLARTVIQVCASKEREKYLFLDEPTLNLDIYYQYKILDLVKSLIADFQIGVCAILHDINQAYIYSDNIVIIKDNTIKYQGTTKEILTSEIIYDVFKVQSDYVYSNKFKRKILITHGEI